MAHRTGDTYLPVGMFCGEKMSSGIGRQRFYLGNNTRHLVGVCEGCGGERWHSVIFFFLGSYALLYKQYVGTFLSVLVLGLPLLLESFIAVGICVYLSPIFITLSSPCSLKTPISRVTFHSPRICERNTEQLKGVGILRDSTLS